MSYVSVSTPFNIDLEFEITAFHKRLLAWCIDLAILLLYGRGMKMLFLDELLFKHESYPLGLDILLVSLPMLLYHLLMEALFQGQSLGKRWMQIRVISLEGGEPHLGQYVMRWIFRMWEWPLVFGYVAFGSLGIWVQVFATMVSGIVVMVVIAVTAKSQRLGDLAAGTTVVNVRSNYSLDDTVFKQVAVPDYKVEFPQVMRLSDRDINAIKSVITQTLRTQRYETAWRVADKVKSVLQINSNLEVMDFLEKLLADYNYLAQKD